MDQEVLAPEVAGGVVPTARPVNGYSLRAVTYFTRTDFDQLYLREDLEQDADLSTFVGHEWRGYRDTDDAYQTSELGAYKFTVRAFENGYLLRVATDRRGVLITTDGLSMGSYEEVAEALRRTLRERDEH